MTRIVYLMTMYCSKKTCIITHHELNYNVTNKTRQRVLFVFSDPLVKCLFPV